MLLEYTSPASGQIAGLFVIFCCLASLDRLARFERFGVLNLGLVQADS